MVKFNLNISEKKNWSKEILVKRAKEKGLTVSKYIEYISEYEKSIEKIILEYEWLKDHFEKQLLMDPKEIKLKTLKSWEIAENKKNQILDERKIIINKYKIEEK